MEPSEAFAAKAKLLLREAGLTYQQAGERMGYDPAQARQAVYRFIHGNNPSAAMVTKFIKALGKKLEDVL